MDSKKFTVLEHIYGLLGESAFSILDADDLCPQGFSAAELDAIVASLADEGYLTIKYADQGEYCLGNTAQGRALVQEVKAERERRRQKQPVVVRRPVQATPIEAAADDIVAEESAAEEPRPQEEVGPLSEDEIESRPAAPTFAEGKTALLVWLAAFLGALLGGGIVGLVMYLLHIGLH